MIILYKKKKNFEDVDWRKDMSDCRDKMLELMLDQDIYIYFYIDYEANRWHLENNPRMPEFTMSETDNPIDGIL